MGGPGRHRILTATVVVGALGYFVDIYDLVLFSIVRVASLRDLGVEDVLGTGVLLLNMQMAGMLVGGLAWGMLGDRRGRVSVLFGSILLYSLANLANAFVQTVPQYAALRFLAGVGLAGELGAAVTLVAESMPKETRAYGTAVVAAVGILGAVAAALVGQAFPWQVAYVVGGLMGLALLAARVRLRESPMWSRAPRGDLRVLLRPGRLARYARVVLVGVPIWFVIGVLVTFAPELARELGVRGEVTAGMAVLWCYLGAAAGDLASGVLSQRWGRRRVMLLFLGATSLLTVAYALLWGASLAAFYGTCLALGLAVGYWAVFATNAAEQFGTDVRATVATTAPNVVRAAVVPITLAFAALIPVAGRVQAALVVGAACVVVALLALWGMPETRGKDLDYLEASAA
ncbi:MAG TPA: MFS transporter [Candidatus Thermoplasmatota archaeon]|nr:MFS transporter [Candidatus Thermoplasmatota archaeon]